MRQCDEALSPRHSPTVLLKFEQVGFAASGSQMQKYGDPPAAIVEEIGGSVQQSGLFSGDAGSELGRCFSPNSDVCPSIRCTSISCIFI